MGTFYPVPSYPYNILPYVVLGWLVVGIGVTAWLARNRADVLSRIGRVFLIEGAEQPYPSAVPPSTVIDESNEPSI